MRVLLLGSQGNLGQQLQKVFANQELISWDREEVDFKNSIELSQKILELKPEVIINAVAYNAVDLCEQNRAEMEIAYQLNRKLVANLAELALRIGAIFIHYSTDYVFSGENELGYVEDDQPAPINCYGTTKYAGELEILKLKKDLQFYLIRTSKLFGPAGNSQYSKENFFDIVLKLSKQQTELAIVDEELSCFTYTPDLAKATQKLILEKKEFGIYHLVNSQPATWYQAAQYLFDISGIFVNLKAVLGKDFSRPAKRPKYSVLLNTKTEKLRSWQKALRDYLNKV